MKKIGKINRVIIGFYVFFLLIILFISGGYEGPGIIPELIIAYYTVTGYVFGIIELVMILYFYLKIRRKSFFLWIIFTLIFISGSIYLSFYSEISL